MNNPKSNDWHDPRHHHYDNIPSSRMVWDTHAFLHEDKFDTWLDLTGLREFRNACSGLTSWRTRDFKEINHFISPDTISELHHLGIRPHDITNTFITSTLPARINHYTLTHHVTRSHMSVSNQRKCVNLVRDSSMIACHIHLDHFLSNVDNDIKQRYIPSMYDWVRRLSEWPIELLSAFCISEDMMYVLRRHKLLFEYIDQTTVNKRASKRTSKLRLKVLVPSLGARIVITHDLFIFQWRDRSYLLDKGLMLEVINKSCECFCTLLYAHMQSGASLPANHYQFTRDIILHYCEKVIQFCTDHISEEAVGKDNKGYVYLKSIEGLGVAELIYRSDKDIWKNEDLMHTLWNSIYQEGLDPNYDIRSSRWYNIISGATQAQIAEVLGLIKLAGHPSIEVKKGLTKLYDRTHENIVINQRAVDLNIAIMTRDIVKNFFLVHKRYPIIQLDRPDLPERIRGLIVNNTPLNTPKGLAAFDAIQTHLWGLVRFGKNFEFDPVMKQVELLKDKSLGLTRKLAVRLLTETEFETSNKRNVQTFGDRRALLNFLLRSDFSNSFLTYLDSYQNNDEWTQAVLDYLVIKLTPKEKEEKPEGRMFGASPQEERNRRIVQELNVMRFMSRYIPDQLLTPDELTMIKKLYSFRHMHKLYPNSTILQVSFDFSKWNNSMRSASIDRPAGYVLDRLFQTNLYGKTMKAYEHSFVYYKDHQYQRYWEGQQGGIEGLNQATWSMVFLAGIKSALEQVGSIYQVTVKGDDVRAALVIPNAVLQEQSLNDVRDNIMHHLQVLCRDMGWSLNPQESFVSLGLICTSKQYQVKDTWLPASMKKMMKAESLANLIFPTTEDIVASVFSTAHSASAQATVALPCFATALLVAARILVRDMWAEKLTPLQIAGLLCWPQVLGGPGALPLQTFFVRGENDMLAVAISLLRFMLTSRDQSVNELATSILNQKILDQPDKKQFLSDPYAIPIMNPIRPQTVMKRLIKDHMLKWVKNQDLRLLLSNKGQKDEAALIETLISMKPMCPKLMTALYENSPFYLIQELISKFMMSTTVYMFFQKGQYNVLSSSQAHRLISRMLTAAKKRQKYWKVTVTSKYPHVDTLLGLPINMWLNYQQFCNTEITHKVRCAAWGGEIIGLTYPSLVDQNLLMFSSTVMTAGVDWNMQHLVSQICIEIQSARFQTDDTSHHYASVDNIVPWLGQQTATKLMMPMLDSTLRSPTLDKLMNLLMIKRTGYYLGHQFRQLLDIIIGGFTQVPLDNLNILMPEGVGGHIAHRTPINSFSLTTMPNFRPNIMQIVTLNNETMTIMKSDPTNRTINYAARHYFLCVLALFELQFNLTLSTTENTVLWSIFDYDRSELPNYRVCPYCCANVEDEMIAVSIDSDLDLSSYAKLPLISTTEYEETALRKNIASAVVGKARRILADTQYDPDNPFNLLVASQLIIDREFKNSQNTFYAAQSAKSAIIPSQNLLDIMGANWIGVSAGQGPVSIKLLSVIPNKILYQSIFAQCFHHYCSYLGITTDTYESGGLSMMQSHWNPIAQVFNRLAAANRLNDLAQGCNEERWVDATLVWPVGSYKDGHLASKVFIQLHEEFYHEMIYQDGVVIPKVKFYVMNESGDKLHEHLETDYMNLLSVISSKLNRAGKHGPPFSLLAQLLEEDQYKPPDIQILNNFQEYVDICRETAQTIYQNKYRKIILTPDNRHVPPMIIISWIVRYFIAATNLERGAWPTDDDFAENVLIDELQIFNSTLTRGTVNLDLPALSQGFLVNHPLIQFLDNAYHSWVVGVGLELARNYIEDDNLNQDDVEHIFQSLDRLHRWIEVYGNRRMIIMTQEQAERQLKQYAATLELNTDEVDAPLIERAHVPPVLDWQVQCTFRQRQDHHRAFAELRLIPKNVHNDQIYLESLVGINNVRPNMRVLVSDTMDYSYGLNLPLTYNWTSTRLLDILDMTGLHDILSRIRGDFLVICTGDGTGSSSKMVLSLYPNSHVIFCSLQKNSDGPGIPDDATLLDKPYEFQHSLDPENLSTRLSWKGLYPGDVGESSTQDMIIRSVSQQDFPCQLIISDAEFPRNSYVRSAIRYYIGWFNIIRHCSSEDTVCIFKLALFDDPHILMFLYMVRAAYQHFHMIRSDYSRLSSLEAYIVISNPRNVNDLPDYLAKVFIAQTHSAVCVRHSLQIVANMMQRILTSYSQSLYYGQLQHNRLDRLANIIIDEHVITKPISVDLKATVKKAVAKISHLCRWKDDTIKILDEQIQQILRNAHSIVDRENPRYRHHIARGGGRGGARSRVVGSSGRKLVSHYKSGMIQLLTELFTLAANRSMLSLWDGHEYSGLIDVMTRQHTVLIDQICHQLSSLHSENVFTYADNGMNYYTIHFEDKAIDLKEILLDCYKRCSRLYTHIILWSKLFVTRSPNRDDLIQRLHPRTNLRDNCCNTVAAQIHGFTLNARLAMPPNVSVWVVWSDELRAYRSTVFAQRHPRVPVPLEYTQRVEQLDREIMANIARGDEHVDDPEDLDLIEDFLNPQFDD